ncbi:MAG: dihydrodipicolinate synthase family protein [Clostridia bacterium]|nr:dihydrodipicolinate synthase family protein [Clostridia bacterium]
MKFEGVMPALITPMTKEGKLNKPVLKKLIEDLIAQGADGFYIGGATGEGIVISTDLHKELTRESIAIVNGRIPCIVHVARMNYQETLDLAQYAESVGAVAVSAIPPLFYKYGDDGIYDYYKGLCAAVKIPVVIYNNPNTGVTFTTPLLVRLFSIENLTAIKWTNYDFSSVLQLKDVVKDANIINGPDEMLMVGLAAGCDACIGTTYNFQLPLIKKIYNAYHAGDIDLARELQTKVSKIVQVMIPWNVIMSTKLILSKQGYDVNYPIYPMQAYTKEQEEQLMKELFAAGLEL